MLDRLAKTAGADEAHAPAEAEAHSEADATAKRCRACAGAALRRVGDWLRRAFQFFTAQSFSSLTRRIVLLNVAGLFALSIGILYLSQFRAGLIDARVQSLLVQGEIIAGAIAASATVETDSSITIDPDTLLNLQPGESYGPSEDALYGIDFPINPERVAPVLRRLVSPTKTRARIYDRDGVLWSTAAICSAAATCCASTCRRRPPTSPAYSSAPSSRCAAGSAAATCRSIASSAPRTARAIPKSARRLSGQNSSMVRINDRGEVIVSVAVPVQRFRAVRGALMLSTQGADIDDMVEAERLAILKVFLIAAAVMVVLSILLAGTIAGPVRRLADAAESVRRRIRSRVEIPDFTRRRDEIGHLSGAFRDMTNALYSRIEAIESFAADVAHELKNPLTSLRSAVETLPLAKTDESRARLLAVIQHDVSRLDRLISDISDASRLDAELQRQEAGAGRFRQAAQHAGRGRQRGEARRRRHGHAALRRRRRPRISGAGPRFAARPGGRQSDRERALVLAAERHRARHLPAREEQHRDRGR